MAKKNGNGQITEEQFVILAIERLRKGSYRGIHARYSGLNQSIKSYFGEDADPVGITTKLAAAGKIVTRFCKGGIMIYKPDEAPAVPDSGAAALVKMGLR